MLTGKNIAVLMGGPGSEREVSLASGHGVAKALRELGATVTEVEVDGTDFSLPDGIDIAFNVIHGTFGEDGQLQRILDERGIRYTGEGVRGSELAFDKIDSKRAFDAAGVPTAPYEVLGRGGHPSLPIPYVLKAPREGSSVGVYIVKTAGEAEAALREAARYEPLLVEQFVAGAELTVGILGGEALPIIQIIPTTGFYDFATKYPFLDPKGGNTGGAKHICPAPLDPDRARHIQQIALDAHRALGLETYSRVDFVLPESGEPVVLEINTIPGMTESSLLPEAAAAAGISYPELCARIIELSHARFDRAH